MWEYALKMVLRSVDIWNRGLVVLTMALHQTRPEGHNFILLHWKDDGHINYGSSMHGHELKARLQQAADKVIV